MFHSHSAAATRRYAAELVRDYPPGTVLALVGPLGAGKTCFVQGLARGLDVPPEVIVNSPTFILCNIYPGRLPLYHFDWYRLEYAAQLDSLGLEEYFDGKGISVVEWADKFPDGLPRRTIWINMRIINTSQRAITVREGV